MEIIYKPVSQIIPYENNPRKNDDAVEYVANSIKEFGFKVPVIIDNEGVIVTGHTRVKAALRLGMTEVPCIVADDLTEEQINAFRLADNKVGELAEWDFERLELELSELDFDMGDFGFADYSLSLDDDDELDISKYSKNAKIPQYEITGEMPAIEELVNYEKTNELIEEINETELDEDVKQFLINAAYRHSVFDYRNIAEFYAHQPAKVQRLMEKSALVIIDVDDAVANGYVKLSKTIQDLIDEDGDDA